VPEFGVVPPLERTAPMVAFIDPDGTFWNPPVGDAHAAKGRVWVPYEDWQGCVGLLEAALRRERALKHELTELKANARSKR
jgi:hypothetical protein